MTDGREICVSGKLRTKDRCSSSQLVSRTLFVAATSLFAILNGAKADASLCATPQQATEIREAYAQRQGIAPVVVAKRLDLPEETVISGLPENQAVGTTDGNAFAKIWQSLAKWERPVVAVPLLNDNIIEFTGPLGMNLVASDGGLRIEPERTGLGGHFIPASIASIHAIALPRNDGDTLYGVIFLGDGGKSIISVFSLKSPQPAVMRVLSTDPYKRTWDLIASMPRHCPKERTK